PSCAAGSRSRQQSSLVDLLEAVGTLADAHAHFAALDFLRRRPDPSRAVAGRADEHHVRDRHRRGLLAHAAGRHRGPTHAARVAHRLRARVALDGVQVLDDHATLARTRLEHPALLAAVLAGEHLDEVSFADLGDSHLQNLRCERDDLHEVLFAQLTGDRPEDARAARVARAVDQHRGVLVERDRGAVVAAERLPRAHDDRLDDLALLDGALRAGGLDGGRDHVADARVAALRATRDADAEDLAGAGVVGDAQA